MEAEKLRAAELKGSNLTKNEIFLVEQFWNNADYELKYYPQNKSIGYHKK